MSPGTRGGGTPGKVLPRLFYKRDVFLYKRVMFPNRGPYGKYIYMCVSGTRTDFDRPCPLAPLFSGTLGLLALA